MLRACDLFGADTSCSGTSISQRCPLSNGRRTRMTESGFLLHQKRICCAQFEKQNSKPAGSGVTECFLDAPNLPNSPLNGFPDMEPTDEKLLIERESEAEGLSGRRP